MKCLCGYEGGDFIRHETPSGMSKPVDIEGKMAVLFSMFVFFVCPKCGTVKMEVEK